MVDGIDRARKVVRMSSFVATALILNMTKKFECSCERI